MMKSDTLSMKSARASLKNMIMLLVFWKLVLLLKM